MNSSGIKRGLAASAVAALAVAGLPFLASTASATAGETLTVVSVGPTLNGGTLGGQVHLKLSSTITQADITAPTSQLRVANPNLNGPASNGNQSVAIVGNPTYINNGDPGDSNTTDGLAEAIVNVAVTTSDVGATATYALYVDDDNGHADGPPEVPDVDAGEARVQVSQSTSGPVASIDVAPTSQSTSQTITSGAYTVTAKDSAGRVTQLAAGDSIGVTSDKASVPVSDGTLSDVEMQDGSQSFTATPDNTNASLGTATFTVDPAALAASATKTATLNVTSAAVVNNANMIDIVTAADDWDGYNGGTLGGTTHIRVDQGTVTINIKGSTPGGTVTLNLDGDPDHNPATPNSITFGGKTTATLNTVLDAQGNGTLTITPDAGTVQDGEEIDVSGSFAQTLHFERAAADAVVSGQDLYFSALKATTTVTATVVDQFGNPVTTGFVAGYIAAGPNQQTPPGQVKAVGADGKVSFDFTDAKATVGQQDTVALGWVPDQFTPQSQAITDTATIRYTATGQGADFNTFLDTKNTGVSTYKASDVTIIPLADGVADNDNASNETVEVEIKGGEPSQAVTLSVDNGAKILKTGEADASKGAASVNATTDVNGDILVAQGYRIIGTKSGVTTLTVTSANRTETAQFTVAAQTDSTTARNLTVTGDETAEHGTTQVPFTVKVTDAWGNGVANVPASALNIQVTGPGQFQDSSGVTNAAGELIVNVRADADAAGDIGITVTGLPNSATNQFGSGANQLNVGAGANSAPGLTASTNQGSAKTTIEAAPEKTDPNCVATSSQKKKNDKVKVTCDPAAAGASVTIKGGGQTKTGVLNESGVFSATFKDKNGNKKATTYKVTVGGTATTKSAKASVTQK